MKKIKFLGMEFNVLDDKTIDREAALGIEHPYIVTRVADMDPDAGSLQLRARRTRTLCEVCGEVCFLDPKSFDRLAAMKLTIVCTRCMIVRNRAMIEDPGLNKPDPGE
jgi:hypothetical protein